MVERLDGRQPLAGVQYQQLRDQVLAAQQRKRGQQTPPPAQHPLHDGLV